MSDADERRVTGVEGKLGNAVLFVAALLAILTALAAAIFTEPAETPEPVAEYHAENIRNFPEQTETETIPAETAAKPTETTIAELPLNRNLNTATAEELMRVPGIGIETAKAIIAERNACGGFSRRRDLLRISGIGEMRMQAVMQEFEIPGELPPEQTAPPNAPVPIPQNTEETKEPAPQGPFEMNRVTREELLAIPGLREAQADAILDVRERIGGFTSFYELTLVDSLSGKNIMNVLADWLYVEGESYIRDSAAG